MRRPKLWDAMEESAGIASIEGLGRGLGIQNHLRAPEQRDGLASFPVRDDGVPHLRGFPQVRGGSHTLDRSVPRSAKVIGLQFERREA